MYPYSMYESKGMELFADFVTVEDMLWGVVT